MYGQKENGEVGSPFYKEKLLILKNDTIENGEIRDGPSPSIIGSIDNVFKSVKDYDSNKCIERMICEYMMPKNDDGSVGGGALKPIRGSFNTPIPSTKSQFSEWISPPSVAQQQFPQQFPPSGGGFNSQFAPHPNQFAPQGQFGRPPQGAGQPSLLNLFSNFIGKKRRRKRDTNLQGNIIRLLKATGLDSMNAFPYVRAGLIGQASDPLERGGNSCARMYRQCPTEPDRLLNYFNNHNGGIINHVQPSVDNEIGPIVSAIISDLMQENDSNGSTGSGSGGLLSTAGSFLSSYLSGSSNTGGSSSSSNNGGLLSSASGLLSSFGGNGGSGSGGNSGVLASLLQSETGILNGAVDAITNYIHGPGPNGKK
ncbi:unnamed protein product [Lepeophtheirus salmonis]|uniref:(salmon louse) hypothetical protein n=1 Tax=Lepeophtheirus salmonis TaxID=72036 RepID=A0A7R8CE13_LEPSM|nr:unnamed protein product [Lepeophtheirus salmonis]CAF2791285.1 unnamed protein product [Lepeophtheirus salmonis]